MIQANPSIAYSQNLVENFDSNIIVRWIKRASGDPRDNFLYCNSNCCTSEKMWKRIAALLLQMALNRTSPYAAMVMGCFSDITSHKTGPIAKCWFYKYVGTLANLQLTLGNQEIYIWAVYFLENHSRLLRLHINFMCVNYKSKYR